MRVMDTLKLISINFTLWLVICTSIADSKFSCGVDQCMNPISKECQPCMSTCIMPAPPSEKQSALCREQCHESMLARHTKETVEQSDAYTTGISLAHDRYSGNHVITGIVLAVVFILLMICVRGIRMSYFGEKRRTDERTIRKEKSGIQETGYDENGYVLLNNTVMPTAGINRQENVDSPYNLIDGATFEANAMATAGPVQPVH